MQLCRSPPTIARTAHARPTRMRFFAREEYLTSELKPLCRQLMALLLPFVVRRFGCWVCGFYLVLLFFIFPLLLYVVLSSCFSILFTSPFIFYFSSFRFVNFYISRAFCFPVLKLSFLSAVLRVYLSVWLPFLRRRAFLFSFGSLSSFLVAGVPPCPYTLPARATFPVGQADHRRPRRWHIRHRCRNVVRLCSRRRRWCRALPRRRRCWAGVVAAGADHSSIPFPSRRPPSHAPDSMYWTMSFCSPYSTHPPSPRRISTHLRSCPPCSSRFLLSMPSTLKMRRPWIPKTPKARSRSQRATARSLCMRIAPLPPPTSAASASVSWSPAGLGVAPAKDMDADASATATNICGLRLRVVGSRWSRRCSSQRPGCRRLGTTTSAESSYASNTRTLRASPRYASSAALHAQALDTRDARPRTAAATRPIAPPLPRACAGGGSHLGRVWT
ncbi:hypothetical protein B0H19DRAFT_1156288 [Mycena capillaripes]|nr:hypothetical protein B0H19DRAFT_1156288 [Mycena capillaripes]